MHGNVKSADGVSIAYRVEGSGNPTLVFVHGWCCDKSYWDPQVSHFAEKYRAVAIDLAGHGESGLKRDKWTVASFGEDVAAVVNHLAPAQVILIGHSMMGAAVNFEAAQRIPSIVGIVAVDAPFLSNRKANQASLDQLAALRSSPDEVAHNAMRKIVSGMFIEKSDPALVERITSAMSSGPRNVREGTVEEFLIYDLGRALEEVTVPVRGISGDHPLDLEAIRQHCPSFQVEVMSEVGHFVMLEDPVTFNNLLEGIIQKLVV